MITPRGNGLPHARESVPMDEAGQLIARHGRYRLEVEAGAERLLWRTIGYVRTHVNAQAKGREDMYRRRM